MIYLTKHYERYIGTFKIIMISAVPSTYSFFLNKLIRKINI